jgi:hypothetical protein
VPAPRASHGQRGEKVLPGAGLEVEQARPDVACTGGARGVHDRVELLVAAREAGRDRCHGNGSVDAGVG